MSWLFSRVLVEEYLGENSLDGEQSVQSNGNHTQLAYCAPDKMTVFSKVSRFGMTFKPLTENLGEELLTLYLEDFHARTLAQQEKGPGLTESEAECGEKWQGSFTKYSPDSRSWKTHQCSLLGDLEPFLETWPRWGLMRDGECWEQPTLEQTIRETGSGLSQKIWPTPVASDTSLRNTKYKQGGTPLSLAVKIWPTPTASTGGAGKNPNNPRGIYQGNALATAVMTWPTPIAQDAKHSGYAKTGSGKAKKLSYEVIKFPTPTCHNSKEGAYPSEHKRNAPSLATHAGGKLNPTWVEWLMGWPLEWTDLKPLETDKFHCVQPQLGES